MSSITLTLSGNLSHLHTEYFPPIDLSDGNYVCGLIDLQTFNSVPNIDESNNLFYYGSERVSSKKNELSGASTAENSQNTDNFKIINNRKLLPLTYIKIPTGSYEISDLEKYIKKELELNQVEFALSANKNTLQCSMWCSQPINFKKPNTIGPLLGFKVRRNFIENRVHTCRHPANIMKVNVIRVECNIIKGAFLNNRPAHTIHEFPLNVPPGYKIIETPQNVIYFPVTVKSIHELDLTLVDQDNNQINFRGETITVRLHLKKVE